MKLYTFLVLRRISHTNRWKRQLVPLEHSIWPLLNEYISQQFVKNQRQSRKYSSTAPVALSTPNKPIPTTIFPTYSNIHINVIYIFYSNFKPKKCIYPVFFTFSFCFQMKLQYFPNTISKILDFFLCIKIFEIGKKRFQ